jgi:hypothetical protein
VLGWVKRGLPTIKAKRLQIQLIDEDHNESDGVILSDIVVQMFGK